MYCLVDDDDGDDNGDGSGDDDDDDGDDDDNADDDDDFYRICMHSCIFDKVISILYKITDHVISAAFGSVQYIKQMYELRESSSSMMMIMMM